MPAKKTQLLISEHDLHTLNSLLTSRAEANLALEEELSKATVLPSLPENVVALRSTARVKDLDSGTESELTLVLPHEANVQENKISVLVPMGTALIGLSEGQVYEWPMPGGKKKRFQVVAVRG